LVLPLRTKMRPPIVNATREQSPETSTSVVSSLDWRLPGSDTRLGRPVPFTRNASTLPLVSPRTRFDADDRNATQFAWPLSKSPSTAAPHEGPSAGPDGPRETSTVRPGCHSSPTFE
jgi:hypothetical protein